MNKLRSQSSVLSELSSLFANASNHTIALSIQEDCAFLPGAKLQLGSVALFPSATADGDPCISAIRNGFYEVAFRSFQEITSEVMPLCHQPETEKVDPKQKRLTKLERQAQKAHNGLTHLGNLLARTGLLHPNFDPEAIETMPFRQPATVIADTSSIIGGSLDFAARFLYPTARIKVPAIAHMEIVNQVDGYLKHRRTEKVSAGDLLLAHARGLGAQNVLLRLELVQKVEIERSVIFQEALRHAFGRDPEAEPHVDTSAPIRSFCDRLILETVRQHHAQVSPGHRIFLMTSDQGLARMALAEGFSPLFHAAPNCEALFPITLSGVRFSPFDNGFYKIPFTALVWELAACFGSVILSDDVNGREVRVDAIGQGLSWSTFQSRDDLLQVSVAEFTQETAADEEAPAADWARQPSGEADDVANSGRLASGPFKFSAGELLRLVVALEKDGKLESAHLARMASVSEGQIRSYLGFLRSGNFITMEGSSAIPTDQLGQLVEAMRTRDFRRFGKVLMSVPSFEQFIKDVEAAGFVAERDLKSTPFWKLPNYRRYGEAMGRLLIIPGDGLYATTADPDAETFARLGADAFEALVGDAGGYVLTGKWLERLASTDRIHPLVARERLNQAHAAGFLERFTRGATPDTRFEGHNFFVVEQDGGNLHYGQVGLFHGDFLIPERSSVELRIERPSP